MGSRAVKWVLAVVATVTLAACGSDIKVPEQSAAARESAGSQISSLVPTPLGSGTKTAPAVAETRSTPLAIEIKAETAAPEKMRDPYHTEYVEGLK